MITESLSLIESGSVKPRTQKNIKGFICSKRFPADGKISWLCDRFKIYNLIRALSDPYPNAFCFFRDKKIYIKKAMLSKDDYRGFPGRICAKKDDGIIVTCGTNHQENQGLLITEIEIDGHAYKSNEYFQKLWESLK